MARLLHPEAPADATADLTVVVVTFNSAPYLPGLLDSLRDSDWEIDGRAAVIEVLAVDNASPGEDPAAIAHACGDRARLIRRPTNEGYGIANNLGLAEARGALHTVANPDLVVQPDCLRILAAALDAQPGAVVGPHATLDRGGQLLHQPIEPMTPWLDALDATARWDDAHARYRARLRSRYAHRAWSAAGPTPMPMLSGCFFMARRETFLRHELFDPAYPLYYEDVDLFRRYRTAQVPLLLVPEARVAHFWSRSSMTHAAEAEARHAKGAEIFFEKHFGAAGLEHHRFQAARIAAGDFAETCPFEYEDLVVSAPPSFDCPDSPSTHLEVAVSPRFAMVAAVQVAQPGPCQLSAEAWNAFPPIPIWVRLVASGEARTLRTWRVTRA